MTKRRIKTIVTPMSNSRGVRVTTMTDPGKTKKGETSKVVKGGPFKKKRVNATVKRQRAVAHVKTGWW
jgi:hypothetical protein